jgi:hypothetical protein
MGKPAPSASILIAAMLATVIVACSPSEQGVAQSQPGDAIISISEGPCPADSCPVYDMTLRQNGDYILHGVRFVKAEGVSEGNLGPDAWVQAEKELTDAGFWVLDPVQTPDTRANCVSGAPTVLITWRTEEGKTKTLTYDAGCGVRPVNQMISRLRTAMHFEGLVWTDDRFNPITGER